MDVEPERSPERAVLHAGVAKLVTRMLGARLPAGWSPAQAEVRFQHRPGAGVSGLYELPPGSRYRRLGASTEPLPARHTLARLTRRHPLTGEKITVTLWVDPRDPRLPGLGAALDERVVAARWGDGDRLRELKTVAYRPLRRAVIRASFETRGPLRIGRTLYLKVLRPDQDAGLITRHELLRGAGLPVPGIEGEPYRHIVALRGLEGESLGRTLRRNPAESPGPRQLSALLDALPPRVLELNRRPAWSDNLDRYGQAAVAALPNQAQRIGSLLERIGVVLERSERGELVPTHGDFYESNLLVSGTGISGLLDLDSLGPGYRVDDLACLLGHLAVVPVLGDEVGRYGAAFALQHDPAALWGRSAAVAVSLIAGARTPGRAGWEAVAEARLRAAEALLDRS